MARGLFAFALAFTGCGEPVRGPVEVAAYSKRLGYGTAADALVVFVDVDGTSRTARTDGAGHAIGEVEAGGSVWILEDSPPQQSPEPVIVQSRWTS